MALGLEQVRHVARLANLALSPEEEQLYAQQLSAILDAVALLGELDTQGVEPSAHALPTEGALREDEVLPSLGAERAVAQAPAKEGTAFAVPRIIE